MTEKFACPNCDERVSTCTIFAVDGALACSHEDVVAYRDRLAKELKVARIENFELRERLQELTK